jgi:hypothetical protein
MFSGADDIFGADIIGDGAEVPSIIGCPPNVGLDASVFGCRPAPF